jgi:CubicO group peptidase (beta-lactamase class C family)
MKNLPNIKKSLALSIMVMLTLVTLLSPVTPVMARENRASQGGDTPTSPSQAPGLTNPAELESFMDKFFASAMEEHHIAGAAVSVVKDGKLFFTKGYGYADLEKGIPVDPEQTIFRIGSTGKVFTWTAVMQLAEQG